MKTREELSARYQNSQFTIQVVDRFTTTPHGASDTPYQLDVTSERTGETVTSFFKSKRGRTMHLRGLYPLTGVTR